MSDAERRALLPGDIVAVRNDAGRAVVYAVKYAPWQLGDGTWVIGLKSISGGYSLDRVVRKVAGRDNLSTAELPVAGVDTD
jgi:ABC-type cobalamin transport system permease subunit